MITRRNVKCSKLRNMQNKACEKRGQEQKMKDGMVTTRVELATLALTCY